MLGISSFTEIATSREATDIDTMDDFEIAEILYKREDNL